MSAIIDRAQYQKGAVVIDLGYLDLTVQTEQLVTFSKLAYDKAVRTLHLR